MRRPPGPDDLIVPLPLCCRCAGGRTFGSGHERRASPRSDRDPAQDAIERWRASKMAIDADESGGCRGRRDCRRELFSEDFRAELASMYSVKYSLLWPAVTHALDAIYPSP
jgi:hypothetical protein